MKKHINIVVPLFREAANVERFTQAVADVFKGEPETYDMVFVDDGSDDDTWKAVLNLMGQKPVKGIRLSRNFGKEAAISAGLAAATGDAVIVMDGDLQHPPETIPELLAPWREGRADVVEAVKSDRGEEKLTYKTSSRLFYSIMNKLSGFDLAGASDFKLLDRRAVEALLEMEEKNPFFRGMSAWVGFRREQVTFKVQERPSGTSRWSLLRLFKLSLDAITGFSSLPLHLVTLIGLLFLIFAFGLGIETLYVKISGRAVSGFATVILLQLIIGSVLMITLGIIGEYIARIFEEVKRRPRYVIAERTDTTGKE